ncbi:GNAT family N-acetyltransferase [Microbulbifer magnicolonia]|uniref:GNAT family N-acetyltransferase n=1 Tax=Microbulbifer magnicolonia TaxID=3109744 RepID=UPI002B40C2AE|nr:GNAT family N-acetyltransferase [Microbulbifer sp. GG15]
MDIAIRPAQPHDLAQMQAIARRTIDKNYRVFFGGDEGVDWFLSGPSDDYLAEHLGSAEVIVGNGQVLGFSVCTDNLIDLMMIDHERHGGGLGGRLLAHMENNLFPRYNTIRLESFAGNHKANNFYLKHGWKIIKT